MKKVGLLLSGVLVGLILATAIPVAAHHNDERFRRRLSRLEAQNRRQQNAIQLLVAKTQALDPEFGDYLGFVIAEQVISQCDPGTPATWVQNTVDPTLDIQWIDDCVPDAQKSDRSVTATQLSLYGRR